MSTADTIGKFRVGDLLIYENDSTLVITGLCPAAECGYIFGFYPASSGGWHLFANEHIDIEPVPSGVDVRVIR